MGTLRYGLGHRVSIDLAYSLLSRRAKAVVLFKELGPLYVRPTSSRIVVCLVIIIKILGKKDLREMMSPLSMLLFIGKYNYNS